MTAEELATLKKRLEAELDELSQTARSHAKELNEVKKSDLTDHEYQASDLEDVEVEAKIVESEVNLTQKIERALDRIAEGTYGNCETCEKPIPVERLMAKPSATLCVPCQEAKESAGG